MKDLFKDYFTFNKAERTGIIIFISVITVIATLPHLFRNNPKDYKPGSEAFRIEVQEFLKQTDLQREPNSKTAFEDYHSRHSSVKLKPHLFNPNTATLNDFMQMGFTEKQAGSIIKYRYKGGNFSVKEDFKKLYIIDDETYALFYPFIDLPEKTQSDQNLSFKGAPSVERVNKLVELNTADSTELLSIKGIGPVFASRILEFREKAGGFNNIGQLLDIYGMDSARYEGIARQVGVDTSNVTRIDINHVTLDNLKCHPYLNYYTAKAIIDKRIQKGKLKSAAELTEVFKNKPGLLEKIRPYLEFGK